MSEITIEKIKEVTSGVYDRYEWRKHDFEQVNHLTGEVLHSAKGVEFPASWSANAETIVVTKYFRGDETSLKHLVDRIVVKYTTEGVKHGYFDSESAALKFAAKLADLIVSQKFAFNSPVWFNVGVPGVPQTPSACFLLSVHDSLESILNWYREEGLIFKGGSGAGVNLSNIRSSYETLSGTNNAASGPVSFMRGADASAGTIKSGGRSRRAAKIVSLDVSHPDIEEFIGLKAREERKIRALSAAGFDMSLNGKDMTSVQYQNANNSVQIDDEFMRAVVGDGEYALRAVTTGETVKTVRARDLFRQIAQAAWECADPGVQFSDTINAWHTLPEAGRIETSNPCGEYLSISDSSCNLGSFNLVKFMDEEGSFELDAFLNAVSVAVWAMDISVTFGDFPTEKISENTKKYRQLGLGVANLGAMLMRMGLPYDSDEGRVIAAEIMSAMTAQAYIASARLAEQVGPYFEYEDVHKEAHTSVLEKHRVAHSLLWNHCYALDMDCTNVDDVANMWEHAADAAEDYGLRNAQVTLAAPTGTISFMMDCDTTGVEPDFALVKYKTLVGGSSMSIINESVPHALRRLGYENVDELVEYVTEHGTVVGAPGIKEHDLAVFDCAIGERAISAEGHLKMMEALQPFLSGAISKTVNLPESVTVEEVEQIYLDAWHKGLKSVTVYRDSCKVGQPLESKKSKEEPKEEPAPATPKRRRLPKQRQALTTSFRVGGAEGYLTTGSHEDGQLGEMFLKLGKQGSTMAGLMDAFSVAVSIALQYGVPLETYVAKFTGTTFEPSGMTDDPDVRMATSIIDYVFRRVAIDHMDFDTRAAYGVLTAAERRSYVETGSYTPDEEKPASVEPRAISKPVESLPLCATCGAQMRPAGTCYACEGCGATSGCS